MNAEGGVQRIEITERESPVFGGAEFAGVGKSSRTSDDVSDQSLSSLAVASIGCR